jgi:hypothetical protein
MSFTKPVKGGKGYTLHVHFTDSGEGYTIKIHTTGRGKGYIL